MAACESAGTASHELVQIDALIRALANLGHWSAARAARCDRHDDQGRRLYATAARLHDQAWADSLLAAYRLFEIDGLHMAWGEAETRACHPIGRWP